MSHLIQYCCTNIYIYMFLDSDLLNPNKHTPSMKTFLKPILDMAVDQRPGLQ